MVVTVIDAKGKIVENASVSVVSEGNRIAPALIIQISDTPLKTNSKGQATLSASWLWGKGYSSTEECITDSSFDYCRHIESTPTEYNEELLITHPNYDDHRVNYRDLIHCKALNATCFSVELEDGSLRYTVNYSAYVTKH